MIDVKAIRERVEGLSWVYDVVLSSEISVGRLKCDVTQAESDRLALLAEVARQAKEIERLQEALDECWVD